MTGAAKDGAALKRNGILKKKRPKNSFCSSAFFISLAVDGS
jgi:hypothetical protein